MLNEIVLAAALYASSTTTFPPRYPTPIGTPDQFGINDDLNICETLWNGEPCSAGPEAMQTARKAGLGWVRYMFYWNNTNPAQGVYDWTMPDKEITDAINAGMKVYATVNWAPAWASEGIPAYEPWHCMNPDTSFNTSLPECVDPPSIDVEAFKTYVREVTLRYKGRVQHWGFGNEAHNKVFWPSGDMDELVNTLLLPGYTTVKEVDQALSVVGPDEDDHNNLEVLLQKEQGKKFFDIISFHAYNDQDNYPEAALWQLDNQVKPVIDAYSNGRDVWITETGTAGDRNDQESLEGQAERIGKMLVGVSKRPWIKKTFVYRIKSVCVDAPKSLDILFCDDTPRPVWYTIKRLILPSYREEVYETPVP